MKNSNTLFTTVLVLFFALSLNAQIKFRKENRSKIKALKIAYITEQLDLSEKEAEKFWPIYNAHENTIHKLRMEEGNKLRKNVREKGGITSLTEKESEALLAKLMDIEQQVFKANQSLRKKLMKFLSPKKILKLEYAERGFKKEMFNRLRKRRKTPKRE